MGRYLARRLLYLCVSMLVLSLVTFFLLKQIPADALAEERLLNPHIQTAMNSSETNYFQFLLNIIIFDFGKSTLKPGKQVVEVLSDSISRTLVMSVTALSGALLFGLCFGFFSQVYGLSRWLELFNIVTISIPFLVLVPVSIFIFVHLLDFFPLMVNNSFWSYVLPTVLLSLKPMVSISRYYSTSLSQALKHPSVVTMRAQGLSSKRIIFLFSRMALGPLLSYLPSLVAGLLSGSVIIELLFNIQGVGLIFLQSIMAYDYNLVIAATLFYGVVFMLTQILSDLILFWADPRIEHS